jgi:hypothetical protein
MNGFLARWGTALSLGYWLYFLSEPMFWSKVQPDTLSGLPATWFAYSMLAYYFFWAVRRFHARDLPAVFLCGALFGWLCEGVVVQTMYDSFPLHISWTGLAWHALISVCAGWLWLGGAFRSGRPLRVAPPLLLLGLFWGWWSVWWWAESGDVRAVSEFAAYAFGLAAPLPLAVWATTRLESRWRPPGKVESRIMLGIPLLYFFGVTAPAMPLALLIAPPLFALTLLTLRRNPPPPEPLPVKPVPRPFLCLAMLALPAIATLIYAAFSLSGARWPTHWAVFIVTTPAGCLLYAWSVWTVWRRAGTAV